MGLEELQRALIAQRAAGVEHDFIEVIARALDVSRELLYRVFYAHAMLSGRDGLSTVVRDWEELLPDAELRAAIRKAMLDGARRVQVGNAIRRGEAITVSVEQLVATHEKFKLCHGCPERMECVAEGRHTPEECFVSHKAVLPVIPLRMTATELEVEAQQPRGRHTIALKNLSARKERP